MSVISTQSVTVFSNVRVFDGSSTTLSDPSDVTVIGNKVATIVPHDAAALDASAVVLDGTGRTLMPGLIDAHWHAAFSSLPANVALMANVGFVQISAGSEATRTLMRGFTAVRDAGGPVFGLKQAIDSGVVPGPRIYPSGGFISQSGGHGDFRMPYEVPRGVCGHLSHIELMGGAVIADGVDEVLRGVREQLMLGASQIKVMAGGGVSSMYDPLDVTQYTFAETRAAVEAAENWGTYVMVHAYTDRAVQQAIRAGVKSIEHGHLVGEETVAMMAEHGTWWSLQPFLDDDDAIQQPDGERKAKSLLITTGTDRAYELAKKHGVPIAWGTDTLFDAALAARQGKQLAKMVRWFTPAESLALATSRNAEVLALSGERNPYPGQLGAVCNGALADLLLVNGDPIADIDLIASPGQSLSVIMKDGVIYKNTLENR